VEGVYGCFSCHAERDWSLDGAPVKAGREGAGLSGQDFGEAWITAANI